MTSIGCRCRGSNVYSRAILITQTLSRAQAPRQRPFRKGTAAKRRQGKNKPCEYFQKPSSSFRHSFSNLITGERKSEVRVTTDEVTMTKDDSEAHRPVEDTKVAIAQGLHLFPFRTEKLNLATPMILRKWKSR